MKIHDHFDGSAHCVECGGPCKLTGDDMTVTQFVRYAFETVASCGWQYSVPMVWQESVEALGIDGYAFIRRANGEPPGAKEGDPA